MHKHCRLCQWNHAPFGGVEHASHGHIVLIPLRDVHKLGQIASMLSSRRAILPRPWWYANTPKGKQASCFFRTIKPSSVIKTATIGRLYEMCRLNGVVRQGSQIHVSEQISVVVKEWYCHGLINPINAGFSRQSHCINCAGIRLIYFSLTGRQ
jgi:hypothetical protein